MRTLTELKEKHALDKAYLVEKVILNALENNKSTVEIYKSQVTDGIILSMKIAGYEMEDKDFYFLVTL